MKWIPAIVMLVIGIILSVCSTICLIVLIETRIVHFILPTIIFGVLALGINKLVIDEIKEISNG